MYYDFNTAFTNTFFTIFIFKFMWCNQHGETVKQEMTSYMTPEDPMTVPAKKSAKVSYDMWYDSTKTLYLIIIHNLLHLYSASLGTQSA